MKISRLVVLPLIAGLVLGGGFAATAAIDFKDPWQAGVTGSAVIALRTSSTGDIFAIGKASVTKFSAAGDKNPGGFSSPNFLLGAELDGLAVDPSGTNLYVVDRVNGKVVKLSATTGAIDSTFSTKLGTSLNGKDPSGGGITVQGGFVYVSSSSQDFVFKIREDGTLMNSFLLDAMAAPISLVSDSNGAVYTANGGKRTVSKIDSGGTVTKSFVTLPMGATPRQIVLDETRGFIYVASDANFTVYRISLNDPTKIDAFTLGMQNFIALGIDVNGNVYAATANTKKIFVIPVGSSPGAPQLLATSVSLDDFVSNGVAVGPTGTIYGGIKKADTIVRISAVMPTVSSVAPSGSVQAGADFRYQVSAAGEGPFTYSLVGAPAGFFVSNTGLVTGTVPNTPGATVQFSVVVKSMFGEATQQITLTTPAVESAGGGAGGGAGSSGLPKTGFDWAAVSPLAGFALLSVIAAAVMIRTTRRRA